MTEIKEIRIAYSEDVINRIANYLASRPYMEVHALIADLQTKYIKAESPIEMQKTTE